MLGGVSPFTLQRHTLSRSYGVNLPSSFSRVLSSALVYSTRPPVSVCGTVLSSYHLEAFLGSTSDHFAAVAARVFALEMRLRICLQTSYAKQPGLPTPGRLSAIRPPIASNDGAGILTCFPSATHLCLALGADSPCSDER